METTLPPMPRMRIDLPARREGVSPEDVEVARRAEALPDSLFAHDPGVEALTRELEAKELRAKMVGRGMSADERRRLLDGLRAQIAAAEQDLLHAALDDALARDLNFRRSIVLSRQVEHLQRVLAAAESSTAVFAKPLPERIAPFNAEAAKARLALHSVLRERKREYIRAQDSARDEQGRG